MSVSDAKSIAMSLIDEADSFILVTRIVSDEVVDESVDGESEDEGQEVKYKAYLMAHPNHSVEMIEYLFDRFPKIPKAVIELRGEEMKEKKIWVPEER